MPKFRYLIPGMLLTALLIPGVFAQDNEAGSGKKVGAAKAESKPAPKAEATPVLAEKPEKGSAGKSKTTGTSSGKAVAKTKKTTAKNTDGADDSEQNQGKTPVMPGPMSGNLGSPAPEPADHPPMKPPITPGQTQPPAPEMDNFILPSARQPIQPMIPAGPGGQPSSAPLLSGYSVPPRSAGSAQAPMPALPAPATLNTTGYYGGTSIFYASAPMPFIGDVSTTSNLGQMIALDEESANALRKLLTGIMAIRQLPGNPESDSLLRSVLDMGHQMTRILRLRTFPPLPRFQSRYDETVLRNRSYEAYEYRRFGSFQTRIDGYVRPTALEVSHDLNFVARGRSFVHIRGSITRLAALTGQCLIEGCDGNGNRWYLKLEMKNLMLRDDGYPSGGWIQFSGWDRDARNMMFSVAFPCPIVAPPPRPSKIHMNPSPLSPARY